MGTRFIVDAESQLNKRPTHHGSSAARPISFLAFLNYFLGMSAWKNMIQSTIVSIVFFATVLEEKISMCDLNKTSQRWT